MATFFQVLQSVARANESTEGVALDALMALEKNQSMGFDYRDVSMPVHVFHGKVDHMVRVYRRLRVHGGNVLMMISHEFISLKLRPWSLHRLETKAF